MAKEDKTTKSETKTRAKRGSERFLLQPDEFHLIRFPNLDEDGTKLNKRVDFGNLEEFANEIEANKIDGKPTIEQSISYYKKDGFYNVTDGERRCLAAMIISKRGIYIEIPAICEPRATTIADRLYKQIILNNSGKTFSPVESAEVVNELIKQGESEDSICKRLNYTKVYLSGLKLLYKSPQRIKDLIGKNVLTSTLAMEILREHKNFDEAVKVIEDTIAHTVATKGTTKINKKDVVKSKGKVNSFSAVRKVISKAPKRTVRMDKIDLFNTLKDIYDGVYTVEFLLSELYEPLPEKPKKEKKGKKQIEMELGN